MRGLVSLVFLLLLGFAAFVLGFASDQRAGAAAPNTICSSIARLRVK